MKPSFALTERKEGNTVGRRSEMVERTKAYIAGFLDGDGSIYFQLMRRHDYTFGYQIRACIVFFQKTSQKRILRWLIHKLRIGYLRDRNDNMSEYCIVGLLQVKRILQLLNPYLVLKRKQAKLALEIISDLENLSSIDSKTLLRVAKKVDKFGTLNYSVKRSNTSSKVQEFLSSKAFVPVSTDRQQSLRLHVVR